MFDTIAAVISPQIPLHDSLFQGGSITELFGTSKVMVRLWHNPTKQSGYQPRITYWRDSMSRDAESYTLGDVRDSEYPEDYDKADGYGLLKVEFSIPHIIEKTEGLDALLRNIHMADVNEAFAAVDEYLAFVLGAALPPLRTWRVQRVDYAWNWDVGKLLPAYMSVLHKLRIGTLSRHPYDGAAGVVWKQKKRWVKFYNKTLQLGLKKHAQILRFEISNYRDTVAYMCEGWFGCERLVGEVVHQGRALYTMSHFWDKLGLGAAESYGQQEYEEMRLREVFGRNVTGAYYVLNMLRNHGPAAYSEQLGLMTKSMYYRYSKQLIQHEFIVVQPRSEDNEETVTFVTRALPALHLPAELVFEQIDRNSARNLRDEFAARTATSPKIFWQKLAAELCLTAKVESDYLVRRWGEYAKAI